MTARHCFNDNPTVYESSDKSVTKALLSLTAILSDKNVWSIGAIGVNYMEHDNEWSVVAYVYD